MAASPKQVDPNTFVPPAVRRAAEQADAMQRAAHGGQAPPAEGENPPAAPENPPAEQAPQPVTQEVTSPPPPQPDNEVTWEHRYKSAEGRWKRAGEDARAMADQIASMQNMIATLQAKTEVPPELRPQSFLTPEEVNEYGSEFLGVVAKKAKEELSPEVAALRSQIMGLEKRLEGTANQTHARARADMESNLDNRLPQWREINYLQDFHSWLALPDTYSGAIRHNLLKTAYEQNNAPRVLAFFRGFLDHEAATAPPNTGPDLSAPQSNGKLPLESFAAPGRAKTAAANAPAEKPNFTHAQIATFYAEVAANKWRGREAEKERIEHQIVEAGREGRVR